MAYVRVICDNCGRMLGRDTVTVFGIDPDFNGCKGERKDPDCQFCNPFYWKKCECGSDRIDKEGICKKCGKQHDIENKDRLEKIKL